MAVITTMHSDDHPIVGSRIIYEQGTTAAAWQAWQGRHALRPLELDEQFGSLSLATERRVCIFAPHPDDEVLGCGGLMQRLVHRGHPVLLVSVTNGTQSHPNSKQYSSEQLNQLRPQETQQAMHSLGIATQIEHMALDIPDGAVIHQQAVFYEKLAKLIQPKDILIPTFYHDGHPDHEATGNVVQRYAKVHGLACYQVLIWALHWAAPADPRINWQQVRCLTLTEAEQQKKRAAINCFTSQLLPDTTTQQPPVLPDFAIDRATLGWELYFDESA